MKFHPTPLQDAHLIELEKRGDDRGFFARLFCTIEMDAAHLETSIVQANNAFSQRKGTLRGLHYQLPPAAEVKIVRCLRGSLYDVILDIRPDSPTCGQWFGAELTAENRLMMYVPRGFAHAILTLTDETEVLYLVSNFYSPDNERGVRWNDPRFGIEWPIAMQHISERDARWPDFDTAFHGIEQLRGIR